MVTGVNQMHKIKVCFFAALRETLETEAIEVTLSDPISITDLKHKIKNQIAVSDALFANGIQASIDFEFARDNDLVDPETTKEVAFFPPVTGG